MTTISRVNVYYTGRFGETGIDATAGMFAADVVSSVDGANSDGTGVACIDCPEPEVAKLLAELDECESVNGLHRMW